MCQRLQKQLEENKTFNEARFESTGTAIGTEEPARAFKAT